MSGGAKRRSPALFARIDSKEVVHRAPLHEAREQEFAGSVHCQNLPASDGILTTRSSATPWEEERDDREGRPDCETDGTIESADVLLHTY